MLTASIILRRQLPLLAATAVCTTSLAGGLASSTEPWSSCPGSPAIVESAAIRTSVTNLPNFELGASLPADFSFMWLRFYQKYLSSSGTGRCVMVPSCSRYSMQAVNTHGFLTGVMMTADRLIHEADEKRWSVQVRQESDVWYLDPLENNDFWWYKR